MSEYPLKIAGKRFRISGQYLLTPDSLTKEELEQVKKEWAEEYAPLYNLDPSYPFGSKPKYEIGVILD